MEVWGSAAKFECMAISGVDGVLGNDSTSVTPVNIRTDSPHGSLCTVSGAATLTSGTAITGVEFFRDGHIMTTTPITANNDEGAGQKTSFTWSHKTSGYAPVIIGNGQLGVFASTEAGTGFITVVWVEIPSSRIV